MTVLPSREALIAIGKTYGQFRSAIGDLRDVVAESIGSSGGSPEIKRATLLDILSIGVRTTTPGADVQIAGSVAITQTSAPPLDPGVGNLLVEGFVKFPDIAGERIRLFTGSSLGMQPASLYFRTPTKFLWYRGGSHVLDDASPGTGGSELLRLSDTEFKYKGQTIYHSGNGVFVRKDVDDFANGRVFFSKGLQSLAETLALGHNFGTTAAPQWRDSPIVFLAPITGPKLTLYNNDTNYSIGIQPSTFYLRTGYAFAVYHNGTHNESSFLNAGTNGQRLFVVDPQQITYKDQQIIHRGITGANSGLDADLLDGKHGSSFVSKISANRPGDVRLWRYDTDTDQFGYMSWDGTRFRINTANTPGTAGWEVGVHYADTAYSARVDAATGRSLISHTSANRPGVNTVWATNVDDIPAGNSVGRFVQFNYDSSRNVIRLDSNSGYVKPYQSDYADTAGSLSGLVGYNRISRGTGSSNLTVFGVHQFAFASPLTDYTEGGTTWVAVGASNGAGVHRLWGVTAAGRNIYLSVATVTWDYITASGDPYIWVVYDDQNNIIGGWEAEDPANTEFPDVSPIVAPDNLQQPHSKAVKVKIPTIKYLAPLLEDTFKRAKLPAWKDTSVYKEAKTPEQLVRKMVKKAAEDRLLEMPSEQTDFRDFILSVDDDQKRNWRTQLILRSVSRTRAGTYNSQLIKLLQDHFKVNPKTGVMDFK